MVIPNTCLNHWIFNLLGQPVFCMILACNMFPLTVLTALLSLVVASSPRVRSQYSVKENHPVPRQWRKIGPAPADQMITLQIGLKQSRFNEIEQHLYEGTQNRSSVFCYTLFLICNVENFSSSVGSFTSPLWSAPESFRGVRAC